MPPAEYETWHLYDAGGRLLRLKVRYRGRVELPDWRDGPEWPEAVERAEAEGWEVYDAEPGNAPGEYAIFHMKRDGRSDRPSQ